MQSEKKRTANDSSLELDRKPVSIERKMSFSELRNHLEELDQTLDSSREKKAGEPLYNSREQIPMTSRNPEHSDRPGEESEDGPVGDGNLHLSQISIKKWTTPKPNDEDALLRVKQVCNSFDGDSLYHYENVDDFDDTTDGQQTADVARWRFSYLFFGKNKGPVRCKYRRSKKGVFSRAISCEGRPNKDTQADQRLYFEGEIAKGVPIIQCLNKGCTNFYDPWDIVLFVGTKDAKVWYDSLAIDPLSDGKVPSVSKHKEIPNTVDDPLRESEDPVQAVKPAEEQKTKRKWWRRKKYETKIDVPANNPDNPAANDKTDAATDVSHDSTLSAQHVCEPQFQFECETCLVGFNAELPMHDGTACSHYNCEPCLKKYFKMQLTNMITQIECPRSGCNERFNVSFILKVLDSPPLQYAYVTLLNRRMEWKSAKHHGCLCKAHVGKTSKDPTDSADNTPADSESWMEDQDYFRRCPGCDTLAEKIDDGTCNIVVCKFCETSWCWLCRKRCLEGGLHLLHCPVFGSERYSVRRKLANYASYGVGIALGVPVIGTLAIGTGAVALGVLAVVGSLSPPFLIGRQIHEKHKLSKTSPLRRRLAVTRGVGLGVLGLPVLWWWGIYEMSIRAINKAKEAFDKYVDLERDDDDIHSAPPVPPTRTIGINTSATKNTEAVDSKQGSHV